jgi:hypothetical protein
MFAVTVSGHEAFKWWPFLDRKGKERMSELADAKKSVLESRGIKNQHSVVRSRRTTSNQESWLCNFGNKELLKEQSGF